ncbi:hypothetical protein KDA_00950 [Dictyobacter alpinus]|uniref:Uncharacterized protein n=1 Tax=Dictyobacter alpinus TaxID=2014873 RepID=A0A402AZS7_9CHLR|nr:hypothetical protein KDA_00950 [Dictyobacter alpinus]
MLAFLVQTIRQTKKTLLVLSNVSCVLDQPKYGISSILPSHWSAMIEAEKHSREVHDEDTH